MADGGNSNGKGSYGKGGCEKGGKKGYGRVSLGKVIVEKGGWCKKVGLKRSLWERCIKGSYGKGGFLKVVLRNMHVRR